MRRLRILCYVEQYDGRIYQSIDYLKLMQPYGSVTLITPENAIELTEEGDFVPVQDLLDNFDVLLLPGGADVDPKRYNELSSYACGRANSQYELLDTVFLPKWIELGKPIIGICRGLQTLNVAMGGSLFQDIDGHLGNNDKRKEAWHNLSTEIYRRDHRDQPIGDLENEPKTDYRVHPVNSFHHQAIKRLAEGFEVLGWSTLYKGCPALNKHNKPFVTYTQIWKYPVDNRGKEITDRPPVLTEFEYAVVPEIIRHTELPYVAFQYHPENLNCPLAHMLIEQTLSQYFPEENQ